jgi:hypothetical protein
VSALHIERRGKGREEWEPTITDVSDGDLTQLQTVPITTPFHLTQPQRISDAVKRINDKTSSVLNESQHCAVVVDVSIGGVQSVYGDIHRDLVEVSCDFHCQGFEGFIEGP